MLAIKINIVLEININGSSSADQRESTGYLVLLIKVTLHLKISWLATSKFIEVLKENEEKEMKENGGQMKRQAKVPRELKTGRLDLKVIQAYEFFSHFSGQLQLVLRLVVV